MDEQIIRAAIDAHGLPLFAMVVCRLGGVAAVAPWGDSATIAPRWRWLFVVLVALVVTPSLAAAALERTPLPSETSQLVWIGLNEAALGAVTGLALRLVAHAIGWTVQLIGPLAGLSISDVFEPSQVEAPQALGKLVLGCALATWLGLGGHRQVISSLLDTFQAVPIGAARVDGVTVSLVGELLTQSCLAGFRAAAPLAMVLLTVWLVVGGVTRLAPRGVAWMWGASLAAVLGLVGLSLSMDGMTWTYQQHLESTLESVRAEWNRATQDGRLDTSNDEAP